jgi:hypothetical protein
MSPKGTPNIGRPRSLDEREQQQIEADIEARETELDEQAASKPLNLSPEEIATLEREKQELAAELKATRPARPGRERSAPESLSSHPIVDISEVAPAREIEVVAASSRLDALESAEQELIALEREESASLDEELRAFEEKTAIQMARLREVGEAKRSEIRARQQEQRAIIEKERKAALPAQIAAKAKTATREAEANRTRESAPLLAQRAEFAQSWAPLMATARKTITEITALDRAFGSGLREMSSMTAFSDTPSSWPTDLRQKFGQQVVMPAREVVRILDNYARPAGSVQDCPRDLIAQAERLLQTWRPETPVANLRHLVSHVNADTVRFLSAEIDQINARFEVIAAQGKEYVASGEVPAEVVVLLNQEARLDMKERHLTKHLRNTRQTQAEGTYEDPLS